MTFRARVHWLLFASYVALFFTLPLTLLWGWSGCKVGALLAVGFLIYLGFKGSERTTARLNAKPLSRAESPLLFGLAEEYARRLNLPLPKIFFIDTSAVNSAVFGFSRRDTILVVTRGLLETLDRSELSALIGRQMACLWNGDVCCESWLSQFLSLMDRLVSPGRSHHTSSTMRSYPFRVVARQVLLYPLTLFPVFVLRVNRDASDLDLKSVRLTRRPHAFAEALRRIEALQSRAAFQVPFSCRHLFLLAPPTEDPLARVFFGTDSLLPRIKVVEQLQQIVGVP